MKLLKITGQNVAIGAQLALMAAISFGLFTNTEKTPSITSPVVRVKVETAAPLPERKPAVVAAAKPVVVAQVSKPASLDSAMKALSPQDAALYRALFAAQEKGQWDNAEALIGKIEDRRLMGSVLADRFARLGATVEEQKVWLEKFSSLPDAAAIYASALKKGGKNLPKPSAPDTWSGGYEIDSATSFNTEQIIGQKSENIKERQLARSVQRAISQNKTDSALKLLRAAEKKSSLSPAFVAEAEGLIAASFFRSGELSQATTLSNAAAKSQQPLGLWIRGLIAWKTKDYATARALFARLAAQPDLSGSNTAAAHFWAYRAFDKTGDEAKGRTHLKEAAAYPKSLYGLLAGQLLGENPIKNLTQTGKANESWQPKHQALLASAPAGWRALALVQIGQNDRAEAELRRINPQGDADKQEAMLALASFVPMPALTVQLASLKKGHGNSQNNYPLPPWQPTEGFKVDRALLFALARHESLFDPMAVSSRGARGLMQIMPATANYVIAKHNMDVAQDQPDALFDPSFNMSLGQKYVKQLTKLPHIGDNLVLLLAAYNGGPGKTLSWIANNESVDPLLFLESIPTRETRKYIARVLPHYWAYRARLGRPLTTLTQLAQGAWPTVSLRDDATLRVADAGK